jgi:hypothetical protein
MEVSDDAAEAIQAVQRNFMFASAAKPDRGLAKADMMT